MDNKRKASGVNGHAPAADTPDRAAKRRRLQEEFGDLSRGESAESTSAYGLNILETIRATTDKNGRAVAPFFESLPSRSANPDYYRKIRLPLSLDLIEEKLLNHQYHNLSALEGDFKRLVSNAKETNARQSEIFGDAERVRKAVSNLMVKYNPAYKLGNYQAVATPLPPEGDEDADGEVDEIVSTPVPSRVRVKSRSQPKPVEPEEDEDAEGEDDDAAEDDEDPVAAGGRSVRRKSSKFKISTGSTPKPITRNPTAVKNDTLYEGIDYKGLTFQQAQEKIVEEIIRKKDDGGDYQHFEVFMFLPARSLKDYYEVIAEPQSVKKLQKMVRGLHGRGDPTWVSDFKTWSAFEDQASLIWKNAYHYNEDGSDIFILAQEFETFFHSQFKQAKQYAPEPPAHPKIKLKVSGAVETPTHPKKITIHVGGKASAGASPAPGMTPANSEPGRNGTPLGQTPFAPPGATQFNGGPLDRTRSFSSAAGSPGPGMTPAFKAEQGRQSPAVMANTTMHTFAPHASVLRQDTDGHGHVSVMPSGPPKKTAADILEAQKYRPHPIRPEASALMSKLVINSHPSLSVDHSPLMTFSASATEFQQDITVNAPPSYFRLQLRPHIAPFLEAQQREWKLHVMHDHQRLFPAAPYDKLNEPVFEATMRYGANRLEFSLVAALPQGETAPNGLNMEMERFTVNYNLQRTVL